MIFRSRNLFALLLALAASARAVSPPWMPLGPFGGSVLALTADPTRSGTLYATSEQGVFKTVDGGGSWSPVSLEKPAGNVAVDPAHPSTLYVRVEGSILIKSTDAGAHWAASSLGLPPPGLQTFSPGKVAVDAANPRRLLLTYLYKAWRSADAGVSWQPVTGLPSGSGASVRDVAFAPRPAGTAFAATASGLYKSTDAGASWRPAGAGFPVDSAVLLAFSPSDPRTVYVEFEGAGLLRSADGGASWKHVANPANTSTSLRVLSVSPRSPRTLYVSDYAGPLYRSTDGGAHWSPLPGVISVSAIAFDPAAPARLYAGLTNQLLAGVLRSDDGGATWTRRSERMTGLPTPLLAVDPEAPDRLWIRVSGLFRSANRGARWVRAVSPNPTFPTALAIGAASQVFVGVQFPFGPRGPSFSALWKTADDGASWTQLTPGDRNVEQFRIAPSDLSTIYTVGPEIPHIQRFYRSTDGGATWERRASGGTLEAPASGAPLPFCFLSDLAVAPSAAAVVYISGYDLNPSSSQCERSLIRSGDGGATWTVVSAGLPAVAASVLAVDPHDPDTVYVGTGGDGVWKSLDGGATWNPTGGGIAGGTVIALLASSLPGRIYAVAGNGRVFRSDDGGASWQGWSRGLRTSAIYSLVADPQDPGRIYAAMANGIWTLSETD